MKYQYSVQETEIIADLLSQSASWNERDIFEVFITSIQENEIRIQTLQVKELFEIYSQVPSTVKFSSCFNHIEFVKKNLN